MVRVERIIESTQLEYYRKAYLRIGNSFIPDAYLFNNSVYGFYRKDQMIAGFIIGTSAPFRTIQLFAPVESHERLYSFLNNGIDVCEVCCFWHEKEVNSPYVNAYIWFNMAHKVNIAKRKFFLGGTYVKGLANLYGAPSNAHLISEEVVEGRPAWIFIAWRKYALLSAIQVLTYKLRRSAEKKFGKGCKNYIRFDEQALNKVNGEIKLSKIG